MTVGDRVFPNLMSSDIGCRVTLAQIKQKMIEFQQPEEVIRERVPSGFSIRKKPHLYSEEFDFDKRILAIFQVYNFEHLGLSSY